jgi:hypothetical protein
MKNKDRNTNVNPALGDGWGHFVPEGPYQEHIKKFVDQEEVSFRLISVVQKLIIFVAEYL